MRRSHGAGVALKAHKMNPHAILLGIVILLGSMTLSPEVHAKDAQSPRRGTDMHLGVVTCAGNTCHGATTPSRDSRVQQNEFLVWHREDKHAKAYTVLFKKEAQRIARNLGLEAAHKEKLCLDCHTDHVSSSQRGKRFQIDDGVGCEACHGGGEHYLGPHVSGMRSHAENVQSGLYPTDDPEARAELCLDCHLGTQDQFATHKIMGAGHPRLSFELDTFTHLEPAHFKLDADYGKRKAAFSPVKVWAIGQVIAAERFINLFLAPELKTSGLLPELGFFDCHACHRPIKKPKWTARDSLDLPPGSIHLNDANLLMLRCLLGRVAPKLGDRLFQGIRALHQATWVSLTEAHKAAEQLRPPLREARIAIVQRDFTREDLRALVLALVAGGARGEFNDYGGAEQAAMALAALADALRAAAAITPQQLEKLTAALKDIDTVLENENAYDPDRLVVSLKSIETALK